MISPKTICQQSMHVSATIQAKTFDEHSNKNGYRLPKAACTCPNRMVVFLMGGYIKNISASGL
jgi:hypothetical protein